MTFRPLIVVLTILASIFGIASLIAACGSNDPGVATNTTGAPAQVEQPRVVVQSQYLPDGRSVTCVFSHVDYGWDVSCDWANAR